MRGNIHERPVISAFLSALLFCLICARFNPIPVRALGNNSSERFFPATSEILYFKSQKLGGINSSIEGNYSIYLMDTSPPPWLPFAHGRLGYTFFASLPLGLGFTFSNLTATAFHDPASSSTLLEVGIGWFDIDGNLHFFLNNSMPLLSGTTRNSVTFDADMELQIGQRLMTWIRVVTTQSSLKTFWFGDEDHNSSVRYLGNAPFIPEISTNIVLPLLMSTMLLATIVYIRGKAMSSSTW